MPSPSSLSEVYSADTAAIMQSTLQFEKANPLTQMTGVARAIALPHEHAAQRFPSFPALERTAVMQFNSPFQWDPPLPESYGMLMRQAAFPLWLTKTVGGSTAYYAWYAWQKSLSVATESEVVHLDVPLAGAGIGPMTSSIAPLEITGYPTTPANLSPLLATDHSLGPYPYFYVPAGFSPTVYVGLEAPATIATTMMVTFEEWAAPGVQRTNNIQSRTGITFANGIANGVSSLAAVARNRWMRPVSYMYGSDAIPLNSGDNPTIIVVVHSATGTSFTTSAVPVGGTLALTTSPNTTCLVPAAVSPDFAASPLPWGDTRLTAVASLFTNVTKALNKEGTVIAARVSPTSKHLWNVTSADLSVSHPAEKAYLPLQHGMYTYAPPSTDLADFWDYTYPVYPASSAVVSSAPLAVVPVVRLDNTALANCFYVSDSDAGTSLAVNLDWHVEFRTTSQLWPIGLSAITLETLHQAQLALVTAGFFFSNEAHKDTIARIVRTLSLWAGKAAPVASLIHPTAGRALRIASRAGNALYPRRGPVTPATTVLDASLPNRSTDNTAARARGRRGRGRTRRTPPPASKPAPPAPSSRTAPRPKRASGLDLYLASRRSASSRH